MAMRDGQVDLNAAARIDEAIEATGATVVDVDILGTDDDSDTPVTSLADRLTNRNRVRFQFVVDPGPLNLPDPERADAPLTPSDERRGDREVIADFLADYVKAAESFGPVEPDLDAAAHVRAAIGRMDTVDNPARLWADVRDRID